MRICLRCKHQIGIEYVGGKLEGGKIEGGRLVGLCRLDRNLQIPLGHIGDPTPECPLFGEEERIRSVCDCYLVIGTRCSLREDGRILCPRCRLPIRSQLELEGK